MAINIFTAFASTYLAAGTILLGADQPSTNFWEAWHVPFVLLLGSALWVPLYGAYKALDAHFEEEDRRLADKARQITEVDSDLVLNCQRAVAELAGICPEVSMHQVAAHVWACRPDGGFDRRARFYLPHDRKTSGVGWQNGVGVAGRAWELNKTIIADLTPVHVRRRELGDDRFNELPPAERYGMTADELDRSGAYKGVAAIQLFSTDQTPTLRGVFLIDYTGDRGFDCIRDAITGESGWRLRSWVSACEKLLSAEAQGD